MPISPPLGDSRSDAELIDAARFGDPAAFGELYSRHIDAVTAMARYYAPDEFSADDLVSDAFERTFLAIRDGKGPDVSFRAYVYTTVRRHAYDSTERRRKLHVTDDFTEFDLPDDLDDPAVSSFERRLVSGAFASLPERWQAVLWYVEVEGMAPPEVAPLLGLTPNGVSALAYRAREGLREAYLQGHVNAVPIKPECEPFRGKLGTYVRGGLAKRELAKIEAHLATCAECSAIVAELRDEGHGLRAVIAPLILGGAAAAGLGVGAAGSGASGAAAAPAALPPTARVLVGNPVAVGVVGAASAAAVAAIVVVAAILVPTADAGPVAQAPAAVSAETSVPSQPLPSTSTPPAPHPTAPAPTTPTNPETPVAPPTSAPNVAVPDPAPRDDPSDSAPDSPPAVVPEAPAVPREAPEPTTAPDLELAFADVGDLVLGRDGMLGLTVHNRGDGSADAVSISLSLPGGVLLDATRSLVVEGDSPWQCVPAARSIECSSPTLPAGAQAALYLPVSVAADADTVALPSAMVTSEGASPRTSSAVRAVVSRGMGTRYLANGRYASTIVGAPLLSCDEEVAGCVLARDRTPGAQLDNNNWAMSAVDAAHVGGVSSSTELQLPSGARIGFAGLYWSGAAARGATDVPLRTLELRGPHGEVHTVASQRIDRTPTTGADYYQSFADVTQLVSSAGAGTWTASSEVVPSLGAGQFAGWSLVVVFEDDSLEPGRVAVFDGLQQVSNASLSFVVAGLADSAVTIGAVAWEGDAGMSGDTLALDGAPLARHTGSRDATNAFDSTAGGYAFANSFGVDAGMFSPVRMPGPRALLTATTTGDWYLLGVVSTTTR